MEESFVALSTLAKRTADARKQLISTFRGEFGTQLSLDLMGISSPTDEHYRFAQVAAQTHAGALAEAKLFLADQDMVALIDVAAPTMPDQELHDTDIITPCGFVYLAEPLPERSGVLPEIPVRAFSWTHLPSGHPVMTGRTTTAGVLLTFYISSQDAMVAHGFHRVAAAPPVNVPGLIPNSTVVWTYQTLIGQVYGEIPPSGQFTPGFYQRVAAAFWTLAQQPGITTTSDEPPGRPTDQRRYRRAGITHPTAPVSVVRLHRSTRPGGVPASKQDTVQGGGGKMTVRALTFRALAEAVLPQHRLAPPHLDRPLLARPGNCSGEGRRAGLPGCRARTGRAPPGRFGLTAGGPDRWAAVVSVTRIQRVVPGPIRSAVPP